MENYYQRRKLHSPCVQDKKPEGDEIAGQWNHHKRQLFWQRKQANNALTKQQLNKERSPRGEGRPNG